VAFRPDVNQELLIDGVVYSITEHPMARGMPYGQEGRAGIVYQVVAAGNERRALKVFKRRFSVPSLVNLSERLANFADMTGLRVCRRSVLTPRRHTELLRQYPDLTYAVLMPWIVGPTWMEVMLEKTPLTPEQSLGISRAFANILAGMEERGVAHCDLSGANMILPVLAPDAERFGGVFDTVELVDVEQLYGPGLEKSEFVIGGSQGYASRFGQYGSWDPRADRFAGAILLVEMLAWCDERTREAAWGETYFDPSEMQTDSERYHLLKTVLAERWGAGVASLLEEVWKSETLTDCPTLGSWLVAIPEQVPVKVERVEAAPDAPITMSPEEIDPEIRGMIELAQRLEAEGNWNKARNTYLFAQSLAPQGSKTHRYLEQLVSGLDEREREATQELPFVAGAAAVPVGAVVGAEATDAFMEDTSALYADALEAFNAGEWAAASELLTEVIRRQPDFERDGRRADQLLVEARNNQRRATDPGATQAVVMPVAPIAPVVPIVSAAPVEEAVPTPVQPPANEPQVTHVVQTGEPTVPMGAMPDLALAQRSQAPTQVMPVQGQAQAVPTQATQTTVVRTGRSNRSMILIPAILVAALLVFGGIAFAVLSASNDGQARAEAEQRAATSTAEAELVIIAAATEAAASTSEAVATEEAGSMVAQATQTAQRSARGTITAQARATDAGLKVLGMQATETAKVAATTGAAGTAQALGIVVATEQANATATAAAVAIVQGTQQVQQQATAQAQAQATQQANAQATTQAQGQVAAQTQAALNTQATIEARALATAQAQVAATARAQQPTQPPPTPKPPTPKPDPPTQPPPTQPPPTQPPPTQPPPTQPPPTPEPPTPIPPIDNCGIAGSRNGRATPNTIPQGGSLQFQITGFTPGEGFTFRWLKPNGDPYAPASASSSFIGPDGTFTFPYTVPSDWGPGRWALQVRGASSGHEALVYFCILR
jgi:hypothetical protein